MFAYTLLLSLFGLPLLVLPALAQQLPDLTDFGAVLIWLATMGGGAYVTGKIFAFVAEKVPAWHKLSYEAKVITPMVVSIAIALGADQLLQYPEVVAVIGPWWTKVLAALLLYLGSQVGHMDTKKVPGYADAAKDRASANLPPVGRG